MSDWRTKAVEDFCRTNNVTVIVDDEWKTREKRVVLRKGKYSAVRRICYDALPYLLPTPLLNEMFKEIPADKDGDG